MMKKLMSNNALVIVHIAELVRASWNSQDW